MSCPDAIEKLSKQVQGLDLNTVAEKFPNTTPQTNALDLFRVHICNVLSGISGVENELIYRAIQWTSGLDKGDFVLAVPALRVKGQKPDVLAKEWAGKWPENDPLVKTPTVSAHFMTFFFKERPIVDTTIPTVRQLGTEYGRAPHLGLKDPKDPSKGKKNIIVEFSSPNVAKPFHAGHLRSTIIGGFLAKLHEHAGWDVYKINYLGDWGKQYGLLALAFERYGDEAALAKDPINHLYNLYVQINKEMSAEKEVIEAKKKEDQDVTGLEANSLDEQARRYFRSMTDGDEAVLAQWRKFRDLSITKYKETYARLNIHFDEYSGESQVTEEAMAVAGKTMEDRKISYEDGGAVLIDFTAQVPGKEGKRLGKAVLKKRDGTALYLTRDVSELMGRYNKHNFDHMLYVVASAQELHLRQLFKITELIGHTDVAKKCEHISFGLVLGMSTRKGTVVFLNDILKDCADHMHEVMKKNESKYSQIADPVATSDILGISSVMVQDMTGKMINNYNFNMAAMTSFEGDTGPYLQYAHARLRSIKRKANLSEEDLAGADLSLLKETHAIDICRLLAQWPDTFLNAYKTREPTTILTYLFRMTHVVSSSYDHLKVVGSEPELMKARGALYDAAGIVLANGMKLLGLTPLDRM